MALGKSVVLWSGEGLTNAYVYREVSVNNFAKTTVMVENVNQGSGILWTIRGYAVKGHAVHSIASGAITTSGTVTTIYSGLDTAFDIIEVGLRNTQSNRTGGGTVTIARRRH
jgi:hypothetical protein